MEKDRYFTAFDKPISAKNLAFRFLWQLFSSDSTKFEMIVDLKRDKVFSIQKIKKLYNAAL